MLRDVRYALRRIRRSPGLPVVAMLTVAIGVGANTAIFSVIRSTLVNPFPHTDARRLVLLGERWPTLSGWRPLSKLNVRDWFAQSTVFEKTAASGWGEVTMAGVGQPVHVDGATVTPGYFEVFGIRPMMGRTFVAGDERPGRDHVAILSHRLWQSHFGGDLNIVGTTVRLEGEPFTIVGVMPPGTNPEFGFSLSDPEIWRPMSLEDSPSRAEHALRSAVVLLKPGVTIERARAELDAIADRLAHQYPDTNAGYGAVVQRFSPPVGIGLESSLYLLFAAAGLVLLLACVNLVNLTLAKNAANAREIGIRTALGASRRDLVRQFVVEQLVLAAGSGGVGVVASYAMLAGIMRALPRTGLSVGLPADTRITIDAWMWFFAFGLSAMCGVACGVLPALGLTRVPLTVGMREGSAASGTSRQRQRLQRVLVVAQVALAFALVVGAAMLVQSFVALSRRIAVGFTTANVLSGELPIPETRFKSGSDLNAYFDQISDRVRALPGVAGVAFADARPIEGSPYGKRFQIVGQPDVPDIARQLCNFKVVSPSYFSVAGLHVAKGRAISDADTAGSPFSVVVNQAMVRTYFKGLEPIGQRMLMRVAPLHPPQPSDDAVWTVVGVVDDEGVSALEEHRDIPLVYVSRMQHPRLDLYLVVRTRSEPAAAEQSIRAAIADVNPDQALSDVKTFAQLESEDLAPDRLRSALLGAFAFVALTLAALGLYGLMAYSVVQRTREIGIRAALGASRSSLFGLVMTQAFVLTAAGLVGGTAIALASSQLLKSFLFGMQPSDPVTMTAVAGILMAVACVACYVPAWRAAGIDPLVALKSE
jgi:putative ABC transport system permease protein